MGYQRIEHYGLIGNLQTAALVGVNSSIDFFCFPRFDSPSVFASLLDEDKGGSFSLQPVGEEFECKQMYVADTNILTTRFLSETCAAEISDLMPLTDDTHKNQIVRIVRVIHGEVRFSMSCKPAFDYARCGHTAKIIGWCAHFIPENTACPEMLLRCTVPLQEQEGAAVASFTLKEGDQAVFLFGSYGEGLNQEAICLDEEHLKIDLQEVWNDLANTESYWRAWAAQSTYKGRWRETVMRSALVLKLMTSREFGSIVAAPTFGIPEHIGGERNWDYRYTWIRDAAFTLYAFMRLGFRDETDAFMTWLTTHVQHSREANRPLQIMYGVDGHTDLTEIELSHLSGYKNSQPVRIGNGAYGQLQLDIYGELMDAVYLYSKYGYALSYEHWEGAKRMLAWLSENWQQPDEGIWEVRGGHHHFLHSRLMCWVAFDRAVRMAEKRSMSAPVEAWRKTRDEIAADIHTNFWNEKVGAFTQHKDTDAVDAAALLMPMMRFISPVDPRWIGTMDAIENSLAEDVLVYRYRHTETADGLAGEEGSFTCCSFWLVEALARAGRVEEARAKFEKLLAHTNHLGLFSEELGRNGHQLGNFPQALTHLALISAATYLDRALSGNPKDAWS